MDHHRKLLEVQQLGSTPEARRLAEEYAPSLGFKPIATENGLTISAATVLLAFVALHKAKSERREIASLAVELERLSRHHTESK